MGRMMQTLGVILLAWNVAACTHVQSAATPGASPAKVAETKAVLRDLWLGHVLGIRNVAVAAMDHNAGARQAAEEAVIANAKQIAASIAPFYGQPASDKLLGLLAGHYGAIRADLDATIAGDAAQKEAADKTLVSNAAEISAFLSSANPNLPKDAVMGLLTTHAAHHLQQFQQLKAGAYAQEAETWSGMKAHMYVVADALTDALAKQFPDKF